MPLFNTNSNIPIYQQKGYHMTMNSNNNTNTSAIQDFDHMNNSQQQNNLSPLLMQQQQQQQNMDSSSRKFNVNATRSSSSSSTNSSVLSALRNSNNLSSLSSSPGNIQNNLNLNSFDQHYDLLNIKNRSKLFEDDVIFCPRSLLSQSELKTRDELDKFLMDRYNEYMIFNEQHFTTNQQQQPLDDRKFSNLPKFNPYASQSFTPGN